MTALFLLASILAQTPRPQPPDPEALRAAAAKFVAAVNARDLAAFDAMLSKAQKQGLGDADIARMVDLIREMSSEIHDLEEVSIQNETAYFQARTGRGLSMLTITLDAAGTISGYEFKDPVPTLPVPAQNSVPLSLPFRGEWLVVWGGPDPADNYHMTQGEFARFAVDFALLDGEGKHFKGDGLVNEDFFGFGRDILAAAPGRVVVAVDGSPDNLPGFPDPTTAIGNSVVIEHAENEYSVYAHLKQGSVKVKAGDRVVAGQVIAGCGNSGRSIEPHLHFGLVNSPSAAFATGFRPVFRSVAVKREAHMFTTVKHYEPRKGDLVSQN